MLLASVKHTKNHTSYCVLQKFEKVCAGGILVVNEMDCPLLQATYRFEVIPSINIMGSISVLHECTSSCTIKQLDTTMIERERVTIEGRRTLCHDKTNEYYSINIYCINYYSVQSLT